MESNKKYGYLIQWLIGIGDLIVLNILFFIVYYGLNSIHTLAITGSLREVVLLLNFCYFFTIMFFLFATCLIFLNVGDVLATFLLVYYAVTLVVFSLWRVIVRVTLKMYRRKGYNFKKIVIVGAGKNGMELYKVMKDDLSYGFNILGFFDDIGFAELLGNDE